MNNYDLSILMCENYDINTQSIHRIYNNIVANTSHIRCTIVILGNYEESELHNFTVLLRNIDKDKEISLFSFTLPPREDSLHFSNNKNDYNYIIYAYKIDELPIIGTGNYELLLYKDNHLDSELPIICKYPISIIN